MDETICYNSNVYRYDGGVSMETGDSPATEEPDQMAETSKESIAKAKSLVDDLKVVQEYEKVVLGEEL